MQKPEIEKSFIDFLSQELDQLSNEVLRISCFIYASMLINNSSKIRVLFDELMIGWCIEKDYNIKVLVAPTGLDRYQIVKGLTQLTNRDVFLIQIDTDLQQFIVELNPSKMKNFNFYISSNEDTTKKA